jgi:hypothetical protein
MTPRKVKTHQYFKIALIIKYMPPLSLEYQITKLPYSGQSIFYLNHGQAERSGIPTQEDQHPAWNRALVKTAHWVVLVILSFLFLVVSMAISEFFTSSALDPGAPDRGPR